MILELLIFILLLSIGVVYYFRSLKIENKSKIILISGCDSGFGKMLAQQAPRLGFTVLAGCLTQKGVHQFKGTPNVIPFIMDITKQESIDSAYEEVRKFIEPEGLWGLVNNAGILKGWYFDFTDVDVYRQVMEVNFFGHLNVTKKYLSHLKAAQGRLVNIVSIAGRISPAGFSAYCASKFAMRAWTESMRIELKLWGIKASCIEPGFMKTEIVSAENLKGGKHLERVPQEVFKAYGGREKIEKYLEQSHSHVAKTAGDPQLVVDAILHALASQYPKSYYLVGCHMLALIAALPGWFIDYMLPAQMTVKMITCFLLK